MYRVGERERKNFFCLDCLMYAQVLWSTFSFLLNFQILYSTSNIRMLIAKKKHSFCCHSLQHDSDKDNVMQNMVDDPHCHPPQDCVQICADPSYSLQHEHEEQQQVVTDVVHHHEYPFSQEDPSTGDYIILTSIPEQAHEHQHQQQQQEAQKEQSFNILDQSVRELFYDESKPDDEQQHSTGHGFQFQRNPEDEDTSDSFSTTYGSQNGFSNTNQSDSDNSSKSAKVSPFSEECLIPLPGGFEGGFMGTRTFVRRRNERERARVRSVNDGFERLRAHLPIENEPKDRRLSKVETLKFAIQYIEHLQSLLNDE